MSTFGEIVEPSTRTAWEDWDELAPERNNTELQWQRNLESPAKIDTFLLFEGKYLSDCIRNHTCNLELINSIPDVNLLLYCSKVSNKYICTIKDYNLVLSSEIVELLRQYLVVSKNVLAIQTKAIPEYQATEMFNQDCIIRALSTSKSISLDINFPKLEQPNIISGVSAGVITLREHLDEAGKLLVCFMEHPEEYQIEEMEKLLEKLDIAQNTKGRSNTILNSNLYI